MVQLLHDLLKKNLFADHVLSFPSHTLEYRCGAELEATVHCTTRDGRAARWKASVPGMIFMEQSCPQPPAWTMYFQTVTWERQISILLMCLILESRLWQFLAYFTMSMSDPPEKETGWLETLSEKYILFYTFHLFVSRTCISQMLKIHWSNYSLVNAFVSLLNYTKTVLSR